ncbi:TPR repeat region-containing protein [Mycobacteroides abscessus]|uniref:TPR repeat region-containing protein n=1 Tax=Mycobacteroides abscessus TaxID=36809 RepID=UPI000E6945C1|nr:hypothetical protein [Mycobacteroides abscessus]MDM2432940.1 hypothetical protein [Mycobacteroides abscessus]MDM2439357.1 hypothetical protein [Mycobacteroides abscessus]RIU18714.1 hypothetical protein D2E97_02830 [Mycobacteroides abscessus]
MGMTFAELMDWPPHIQALSDAAAKRGEASQRASDKVQAIVDMSTWQGDAGEAAKDAMKRSAARFDQVGMDAIFLAMHINKAHGESQTLADDIKTFLADAAADPPVIIDPKTNAVTPPDITGKKPEEIQKIINKLKDLQSRASGLIARGENLDAELARVLDEGTGGHTMDQKRITGNDDATQAREDVTKVLNNSANDEERARVTQAMALTPEQQADMDAGRPVQLSSRQQLYLGQMQAQMNGMTVDDIYKAQQDLKTSKNNPISNALQLMSSKQVSFADTGKHVGDTGSTDKLTAGGFEQLPKSVRASIDPDSAAKLGIPMGDHLGQLSTIVKEGDPGLQHGTGLDQKMMDRAANLLHGENSMGLRSSGPFDSTLQQVFESAGRDHVVDHDLLVGDKGKQFFNDLSHHTFPDNGKSAGGLMSWTHDSALVGKNEFGHYVSADEARISGETAHAYASYAAEDKGLLTLKDDDGNTHTLGQTSPELVKGMAHGLMPYAAMIGGAEKDNGIFPNTPGFDHSFDDKTDIDSGKMPKAKALLSVLNTNTDAGKEIDGALYVESAIASDHFASTTHDGTGGAVGDLDKAARMRALADLGINQAADASTNNKATDAYQHAKDVYEMKQLAYDTGAKGLSALVGAAEGPAGTIGGPAIDIAANAMKSSIVGDPPDPASTTHTSTPEISTGNAQAQVIDSLLSRGVLTPEQVNQAVPNALVPPDASHSTWHLKNWQEMGYRSSDNYHTMTDKIMNGPVAGLGIPGLSGRGTDFQTEYRRVITSTP